MTDEQAKQITRGLAFIGIAILFLAGVIMGHH